jgi:anti-sigma factor RsiW
VPAYAPSPPPKSVFPLAADCFTSRLHLHAYVDGELDSDIPGAAFREVISGHLAHCERCARLEAQLRAMRQRLRECGASGVPADERPSDEFRAKMARLLAG